MSIERNLCEMELSREAYWLRYPGTSPFKLRRRALTVRHCLHVLPGETILEVGAGSGLWTENLTTVLRGENPITAAVFNEELAAAASAKRLANTRFIHGCSIAPCGKTSKVQRFVQRCPQSLSSVGCSTSLLLNLGSNTSDLHMNISAPRICFTTSATPEMCLA